MKEKSFKGMYFFLCMVLAAFAVYYSVNSENENPVKEAAAWVQEKGIPDMVKKAGKRISSQYHRLLSQISITDNKMPEDNGEDGTEGKVQADTGEDGVEGKLPEETEEKIVALTFDDGPHPTRTKKLLDGLKERNVKVTFFLIGRSIEGNEELIKQMVEDGHLIGNHTYSHVQLSKITTKAGLEEIQKTNEMIYQAGGIISEYIRPPYGSWNDGLTPQVDMRKVLWNVDPLDWKVQNTDEVVSHVVSHVKNGSIILLHDVYETSVDAALRIVDILQEQGYTFVTADEMFLD